MTPIPQSKIRNPQSPAPDASLCIKMHHPAETRLPLLRASVSPCLTPPPSVRPATPADLPFIVDLQKRETDAVGFCTRMALAEKIDRRQIWLSLENDQPAGFLHHGTLARNEVRIFQTAIDYDARRRRLGLALVQDLESRAVAAGATAITLRCLSDLDANDFWRAAGYRVACTEPGGWRRGRTLYVWARELRKNSVALHSRIHPCPLCGKATTGVWTAGARRWAHCPACAAKLRAAQQ